jgi:signal recognition particle receptor subunit beta
LAEARVIVLAEAGSGKTEAIRHICRRRRTEGNGRHAAARAFDATIDLFLQELNSVLLT